MIRKKDKGMTTIEYIQKAFNDTYGRLVIVNGGPVISSPAKVVHIKNNSYVAVCQLTGAKHVFELSLKGLNIEELSKWENMSQLVGSTQSEAEKLFHKARLRKST